ncbi:SDR family NAD(P)-dependent oxidoreductase [Nocardioides bizhenqiangii]|uniref:SDR family NAD(P)-dependent oxidoreductase n=1 Tax=Nocardioides bizhenqiangii TaxID=3095076 RepID=A0ABZ0ZNW4_9ACTN|nr:SDR family NAD(P)-dependent oxidoreductase [Nocardioides sp. HM61]WQQ25504.1 SDR family NAD(P)-dependent oxidoreductase [Nocardioides sp. HM61]
MPSFVELQRRLARLSLDPIPSASSLLPGHAVPVAGKRILITGASSGVGRAAAVRLAGEGATVLAVARRADELDALTTEIAGRGGRAYSLPCDLTETDSIDALADDVITRYGGVDVLVNNAGHSIRRSAADTVERPFDHDRLMRLNYHASVRLTLNLLAPMRAQGGGQVINSSTWGVPGGLMPMFTAYHASKAALAAFSRSLQAEERRHGIVITSLHFPLMRTPMIAPTKGYDGRAALEPDDAARWVVHAVRHRPVEMTPAYASLLDVVGLVSPRLAERLVTAARP